MSPAPTTDGDALWRWSATRLARAIKDKEISSVEAVTSSLERIEAVNPRLNALPEVMADEAIGAAKKADQLTLDRNAMLGPLHGVPLATKVNSDQLGHATTDGLVALADDISPVDSPQVAHVRSAGGIIVGRSNSPAFSYRWFTTNDVHGKTLNPWHPGHTPGGSSGGAASAIASGMVPVAQGNDIGGSIRHPAFACGVVGLRPTVGRVAGTLGPRDMDATPSVQLMCVDGPLGRCVDDLRLGLQAMAGFDPRDPVSVPPTSRALEPTRPMRIGVLRGSPVATLTSAVEASLEQAATWLEEAGYELEEVELPQLEEAYRLWWLLCLEDFRLVMPLVEQLGDSAIRKAAEHYYAVAAEWWGTQPDIETYIRGYARRGTLIRELQQALESHPAVLLPVSAEQAFEQDADISSVERARQVIAAQYSMMAIPLLGFPALSVPTGVTGGLPTGVQLLGRRFDEELLLNVGATIEARAGHLTPIDPR